MDNCAGDGSCFQQCPHHGNLRHPKFYGGGRRPYCKVDCTHDCQLVECRCGLRYPQRDLNYRGGICFTCFIEDWAKVNM